MQKSKIKTELSIKPLFKYLKQRQTQQDSTIAMHYEFLLKEFQNDFNLEELSTHTKLQESIVIILNYILKQEKGSFWALTSPLSSEIYYKSESLSNILNTGRGEQHNLNKLTNSLPYTDLCYKYILEYFYNFTRPSAPALVHEVENDDLEVSTYFQITQDNRFVEVSSDIPPPDIDVNAIDLTDPECPELLELKKLLPLDHIRAQGFSILTFKDVTVPKQMTEH